MREKRGQITIFIIIGIVILGIAVLSYMFYPRIIGTDFQENNPSAYLQTCIEEDVQDAVSKISLQGGSLEPEHYYLYQGNKIEYLCYTSEYYKTCVVQQPMLQSHIESEIKSSIENSAESCLDSLKESYEKKGYEVSLKKGDLNIELVPEKIRVVFNSEIVIRKESSQQYDSFIAVTGNNLYELVSIANSILEWEIAFGDSETTLYMDNYPELKVEKKKQTDGTTIYILTERNTENKFQFASRSIAWPPGYGLI